MKITRRSISFVLAAVVLNSVSALAATPPPASAVTLKQFLHASPAVKGALAQINQIQSATKSCTGLKIENAPEGNFIVTASCSGADAAGDEWAEMLTIEVTSFGEGAYHIQNIKFDLAG